MIVVVPGAEYSSLYDADNDARVRARVLEHVLRAHSTRGSIRVEELVGELGGANDIQLALAHLVSHDLMEVIPDERVQPTEAAIRFWELVGYMDHEGREDDEAKA